jgi:hypothetical protein
MKRTVYTLLPILAIALVLGTGSAMAQNAGDNSTYAVDYFSYALTTGAPDGTLRVINDGDAAGADLCASVYVFDNSQELSECCSIRVTADGIISESVNRNLLSNPLTGVLHCNSWYSYSWNPWLAHPSAESYEWVRNHGDLLEGLEPYSVRVEHPADTLHLCRYSRQRPWYLHGQCGRHSVLGN